MSQNKNVLEVLLGWVGKFKYILFIILLAVISAIVYFKFIKNENTNTEEYIVIAKNLEEGISLTGRVQASNEANLSFEKTGIVRKVLVISGQKVSIGQTLATLSGDDDFGRVQEAQASLASQKALLEDLTTGARTETLDNKRAALSKAQNDLAQAYKNAGDSIKNAAISGNTYVRDNLASSFSGNLINGYKINTNTCDSIAESNVNSLRAEAERALIEIEKNVNEYPIYENNTNRQNEILQNTKNIQIKRINDYLDALKNLFSLQCVTSNLAYDSTRLSVSTARSSWSSVSTDLSLKLNLIDTAKTNIEQAKNDLQLAESGEKSEKIKQQEANVKAAAARLTQANAESNKNVLRAPFSGIITNVDVKLGELVSPGGKSISLISANNFEIESKVSEVDVTKLKVGDKTSVSFDTYGSDEKFEATVSNISPAGIISDGVPTYKTIFTFVEKDERVRSGMTANIDVVTNVKENIISVPAKFIKTDKDKKTVTVKTSDKKNEIRIVKLGTRGINGDVEISEGLNQNDVIISEKK